MNIELIKRAAREETPEEIHRVLLDGGLPPEIAYDYTRALWRGKLRRKTAQNPDEQKEN